MKKIATVLPGCVLLWGVILAPAKAMAGSIYYIGNSLTGSIAFYPYRVVAEKIPGQKQPFGIHLIGGANIKEIWNNPEKGSAKLLPYGYYTNALNKYSWDFLSLQPFYDTLNNDVQFANRFINLAAAKNPNVQILINGVWGWKHWRDPKNITYSQLWSRAYSNPNSINNRSRDYQNQLIRNLRATNPRLKPPKLVPTGEVFNVLDQLMRAGRIPGYSDVFSSLFSTDQVHVNAFGGYIGTMTYLATMYGVHPARVDAAPILAAYTFPRPLTPSVKAIFDQTIWNTVTNLQLAPGPNFGPRGTEAVPEPLTIAGASAAVAFGIGFKRRLKRS